MLFQDVLGQISGIQMETIRTYFFIFLFTQVLVSLRSKYPIKKVVIVTFNKHQVPR